MMLNKRTYSKIALKSLFTLSLILSSASAGFAESGGNEGTTMMRVRAHMSFAQSKQKFSQALNTTNLTLASKKSIKNGFGGEISVTHFITDSIATEVGVGLTGYKLKKTVAAGSGTGTAFNVEDVSKKNGNKRAYFIPVTATAQYHISPEEQFSPYVGVGYHYAFAQGSSGYGKFSNAHGPVLQAGFDFWDNDDLGFNLDVKKYWAKSKFTLSNVVNATTKAPLKSKVNVDPLIAAVGIGFRL